MVWGRGDRGKVVHDGRGAGRGLVVERFRSESYRMKDACEEILPSLVLRTWSVINYLMRFCILVGMLKLK